MKHYRIIPFLLVLFFSCKQETYHTITIHIQPADGGDIVMTPFSSTALEGSSVTFTAQPKGDYIFTGWSGSISGADNPKTITVTSDLNITANFTLKEYPLTLSTEGEGAVSERVITTKTDYASGTVVELTAKPADHWLFDHWEGDLNGTDNPTKITVISAKTVKAVFVKKMYDLTVEVQGEGSVEEAVVQTKSGSYQEGTVVELTAQPGDHWVFDHWEGDLTGSDNPAQVTVLSHRTVKAVFVENGLENDFGPSNCYIVSAAGDFSFPTVYGNSANSIDNVQSAIVIWETRNDDLAIAKNSLIQSVYYKDGRVYFSTNPDFKDGNAMVAVIDEKNTILWSWHIWLCKDYDAITSAEEYPDAAGIAMDRDIGALSSSGTAARGLLFQWGRKDPFVGWSGKTEGWFGWYMDASRQMAVSTMSSNYVIDVEEALMGGANTLAYSIAHPATFIYSVYSPWDWFTNDVSKQDDSLWGRKGKKTQYDPCPPGWRVPDGGPNGFWSKTGISSSTLHIPSQDEKSYRYGGYPAMTKAWANARGREFQPNGAWFGSSGFRSGRNGDLGGGGYYGVYWTSFTDGYFADAMHYGFFGEVYPSEVNVRNYGFSIRCVKEM